MYDNKSMLVTVVLNEFSMPFAIFLCLRQRELNNKIQIWWISNGVVECELFFSLLQHVIENQQQLRWGDWKKKFAYSVQFTFVSIGMLGTCEKWAWRRHDSRRLNGEKSRTSFQCNRRHFTLAANSVALVYAKHFSWFFRRYDDAINEKAKANVVR